MHHLTQPTFKKYVVMQHSLLNAKVKDKRRIFATMRRDDISHNHLLPELGCTLGEFCMWHIIGESRRKSTAP